VHPANSESFGFDLFIILGFHCKCQAKRLEGALVAMSILSDRAISNQRDGFQGEI